MSHRGLGIAFYFWYAWHNLTEKHARKTTTAVVGTLIAVQSLALIMLGLTEGYQIAQVRQITSDPLALCLFAGSRIQPNDVTEEKRQLLEEELAARKLGTRLFFVERTWMTFAISPESALSQEERMSFKGRTIQVGDPILLSYGINESHANQFGVVLTPMFLREYGSETPPKELVFYASGSATGKLKVPVLGTTDKNLPDGFRFLISEDSFKRLQQVRGFKSWNTGGISESSYDWNSWSSEAQDELSKLLGELQILAPPRLVGSFSSKVKAWRLQSQTELDEEAWLSALRDIRSKLQLLNIDLGESFLGGAGVSQQEQSANEMIYDSVEILASKPTELPLIAEILRSPKINLKFDNDVVDQLVSISNVEKALSSLLGIIAILVLSFSGFNIYTILEQRAEYKCSEFGMLKAMGMRSFEMKLLSLTEGFLIWLSSLIIAVVLCLILGYSIEAICVLAFGKTVVVFVMPLWLILADAVCSCVVALTSSMLASRTSRRASPAQSLASIT